MFTTDTADRPDFSPVGHSNESNSKQLDRGQAAGSGTVGAPRTRADVFARSIGSASLTTLRDHHLALAMAVIELAADAGRPLPWTTDDPTVALLRAAAKLAIDAPHAQSAAAADLVGRLG